MLFTLRVPKNYSSVLTCCMLKAMEQNRNNHYFLIAALITLWPFASCNSPSAITSVLACCMLKAMEQYRNNHYFLIAALITLWPFASCNSPSAITNYSGLEGRLAERTHYYGHAKYLCTWVNYSVPGGYLLPTSQIFHWLNVTISWKNHSCINVLNHYLSLTGGHHGYCSPV